MATTWLNDDSAPYRGEDPADIEERRHSNANEMRRIEEWERETAAQREQAAVQDHEMTEVTKPDGTRFVSRDTDLEGLSRVYREADGYSLRPVAGEHRDHGFKITEYMDREAGQ